MNLNPRQTAIISMVNLEGPQTLEALAERFNVSVQTLRRDVTMMGKMGLLARFHGGVRMPMSTMADSFAHEQQRQEQANTPGRMRIAKAVVDEIPAGCSLILGAGAQIEVLARCMLRSRDIRVITHSLKVADILMENRDCEVVIAGGTLNHADYAVIGDVAADFIRQFKVNIAILEISGVDSDGTLRGSGLQNVKILQTSMAQAQKTWIVAESSVFNRPAMVEVGRLSDVNRFFVDEPLPPAYVSLMKQAGVKCTVASEADD